MEVVPLQIMNDRKMAATTDFVLTNKSEKSKSSLQLRATINDDDGNNFDKQISKMSNSLRI